MISIVVYGRNDSYGYNLHKRAALGINCMAELLDDENDEILFVDYNTPDDHPTFPEAIADTLTVAASARLRTLRVRPSVHNRWSARSHLKAIEPIARNVAIRRSNPRNRWILSTNTDMIFVPRAPASLGQITSDLPKGFYHLPRFELPESLWEGFDRKDPASVIDQVRCLGREMFLNEIVYGSDVIKYDAPGDFQLMEREDLFRIHGFNEDMLLGWHVDSNIAKRLHLLHGRVGDVVERLFGYHCDHTRQVTPMHQHRADRNDEARFIGQVTVPEVPHQADTWGCAGDEIEEVRLRSSTSRIYLDGLRAVIRGECAVPTSALYTPDSFDQVTYDPRHVLPFLADLFSSAPRATTIGWIGGRGDTFQLFCSMWERLGATGYILREEWASPLLASSPQRGVKSASADEIDRQADALIFDFGAASESPSSLLETVGARRLDATVDTLLRRSFMGHVEAERHRTLKGGAPRRFVCINAVHNTYETMTQQMIGSATAPFATRLRHGFVIPVQPGGEVVAESGPDGLALTRPQNLLGRMNVGTAGRRARRGVRARFGKRGYVIYGPYMTLPPGTYRVEFHIEPRSPFTLAAHWRPIIIEVVAGAEILTDAREKFLLSASLSLTFAINEQRAHDKTSLEFRIFCGRYVDFVVTAVMLMRVDVHPPVIPDPGLELFNALGLTRADGRSRAPV